MKKRGFNIGVFFLIGILLLNHMFALGVSPGRKTLDYEEGFEGEFTFNVLNSEEKDMRLVLSVEGDLKDYIYLEDNELDFSSNEKVKSFDYSIILEGPLPYGRNLGRILISEVGDDELVGFGGVSTVVMEVVINVPYPGKYVELDIMILEAGENESVMFLMPVINRGEEDLDVVRTEISILDRFKEVVGSVESESISIISMERKELDTSWLANVPVGIYYADIALIYDDEVAIYHKSFRVGDVDLSLLDIFIEDFELGNIAVLKILVQNKWSEELTNVYAHMVLFDEADEEIANIKSAPYDIPPLESIRIPLYWDTIGIGFGRYHGWIEVIDKEDTSKKDLVVIIDENGITLELDVGGFVFGNRFNYFRFIVNYLSIVLVGWVLFLFWKNFHKKLKK